MNWTMKFLSFVLPIYLVAANSYNVAAFTSLSSPALVSNLRQRHYGLGPLQASVETKIEPTRTQAERKSIQKLQDATPVPAMDVLSSFAIGTGADAEYKRGLLTIGFITLLFASNSPVLHGAFSGSDAPPVLLLNAAVSVVALVGLVLGSLHLNHWPQLCQF